MHHLKSPGRALALAVALLFATLLPAHLEAVPAPSTQVRLMTWNVGTINPVSFRLPQRYEGSVAETLVASGAEVACLQEVKSQAQARRLRDLVVAKGGPVYSVTTYVNDPRRSDGRLSAFFYSGHAAGVRVWVSSSGYRAAALVLDDVTVVDVHGPAGNYKKRRTFYPELVQWTRSLPQPVVIAGDFNLGPRGGAGMAAFLPWLRRKDKQIYDDLVAAFADHTDLRATTFYGLVLDHVMISDGRILTQQRMLRRRRFPQDHRPILTELLMPVPASRPAAIRTLVSAGAGGGSGHP